MGHGNKSFGSDFNFTSYSLVTVVIWQEASRASTNINVRTRVIMYDMPTQTCRTLPLLFNSRCPLWYLTTYRYWLPKKYTDLSMENSSFCPRGPFSVLRLLLFLLSPCIDRSIGRSWQELSTWLALILFYSLCDVGWKRKFRTTTYLGKWANLTEIPHDQTSLWYTLYK